MKDPEAVKRLITNKITLGEILRGEFGISLDIDEIQLSCPFHGVDAKKSTRYYRETDSMYCWVCKKSWDIYGYISEKENLNFARSMELLIKKYNVDISGAPDLFSEESSSGLSSRRVQKSADGKALAIEKIKMRMVPLRDKLDPQTYAKIVFAFMILKHNTKEEKFLADANKLANLIVKLNNRG